MARAKVFLKPGGPISKQIGARKFEGQAAHVMTDASEILSFKHNPMFIVEDLDGEPTPPPKSDAKASVKPPKPAKAKGGKPKAKPAEEDSSDDEDEAGDDEDEAGDDGPDLSEDALRAKTKAQLVDLAADLGIEGVDVQKNKDDIIARIRTASKE